MIGPLHAEVVLAASYSAFLVLVAAGLEWFGRLSHRRSGRFSTAGFAYHERLDKWECPCGHYLHLYHHDRLSQTARYRAPAHACNACHKKPDCTDSDEGREVVRSTKSWIETAAGQFHRGLSLALLSLAALILAVEMLRHSARPELLLLGLVLAAVTGLGLRLWREFTAPTGPGHSITSGMRGG